MEFSELTLSIFIVFIGLCFGSFITLASYRLPRGGNIFWARSECPACLHLLTIRDLVPLFSWLLSKGHCRHCKVNISVRYPLTELLTAAWFLLVYHLYGFTPFGLILMGVVVFLMILIVTDLELYIIPDTVHVGLIALAALDTVLRLRDGQEMLIGGAVGLGIGLMMSIGYLRLMNKPGLGFGDVKFLAVSGLWLGPMPMIPYLVLAGLLGVISALIWRMLGKGRYFPFGPALAMSLFVFVALPDANAFFWDGMRSIILIAIE